ncbi:MAG: dTMP kinase [Candidatus Omnitrophica bacterium]|nr:dTMP kinase [Candidatus Omnitrophota bacterium]
MPRVKFITFEGPEGSGKSTQARLLYLYLRKRGFKVIFLREPGKTKLGERIRRVLLNPKTKLEPIEETVLYFISRKELLDKKIIPAIKEKKIVVCDRFSDSTFAYQGWGLKVNTDFIKSLEELTLKGIKPDITFLLDLPVGKGLKRCGDRKDRIEKRSLDYHKRVREGYLKLAKRQPQRIKLIRASLDKEEIHRKIIKYVFSED